MRFMRAKTLFSVAILGLCIAWCGLVAAGFSTLMNYAATPGEQAPVDRDWPEKSHVERLRGGYNLVMALHPRCPCSHASVVELERILMDAPTNVRVHVLAFQPSSTTEDDGWPESELLRRVRRISGVYLYHDNDAGEAERFGARTSGQVALYGPRGELLFHGGITSSRGHEGETLAHQALRSLLRGKASPRSTTPVFGCPLRAPLVSRCNNER